MLNSNPLFQLEQGSYYYILVVISYFGFQRENIL